MNGGVSFYVLQRVSQSEEGTFGVFFDPLGTQLCVTCEPPPDVEHPCIPEGTYNFSIYESPTKGQVWITQEVPARTNIEIHIGNTDADTLGCICVGTTFGWIGTQQAVTESVAAMTKLRAQLPPRFYLTVKDVQSSEVAV